MPKSIKSAVHTTEASESLKKTRLEINVEDPSPDVAMAAISKNVVKTVKTSPKGCPTP